MIVMKFGGTSVEDAHSIERVVEIVRVRLHLNPIIVVSAMGKTTRKLLQAAEASVVGDDRMAKGVVADLKARHISEARGLAKGSYGHDLVSLIEGHCEDLEKQLEGLSMLGEVPLRSLDRILAYGELFSSAILTAALCERGIPALFVDARELIKTDDRYGAASPLFEVTNQNLRNTIPCIVESGKVPVIQGSIGSAPNGATTTLGFEGSDYTATIVGAALNVADIQIWKDVSGLMTADPKIVAGARTVKVCSFAEAADLTFFGAKVLHPKAIHPAACRNIPVHIYNSKRPEELGTMITTTTPSSADLVKSIAYKRPVTIINATAAAGADRPSFISVDDLLRAFVDALARRRIQPLIVSAAGTNVVIALDSRELRHGGRELIEAISEFGSATAEAGRAIISMVGEGVRSEPSLVGRALKAIDGTESVLILLGASPLTISFVVAERDIENVIARLHGAFFGQVGPHVFQ